MANIEFRHTEKAVIEGDCSTFALGWKFPYSEFFGKDPVSFFQDRGDTLVFPGEEKTGDIVFFLTHAIHVATVIKLEDGTHYLSQMGFRGEIVLSDAKYLTDHYGPISLIARLKTKFV